MEDLFPVQVPMENLFDFLINEIDVDQGFRTQIVH